MVYSVYLYRLLLQNICSQYYFIVGALPYSAELKCDQVCKIRHVGTRYTVSCNELYGLQHLISVTCIIKPDKL